MTAAKHAAEIYGALAFLASATWIVLGYRAKTRRNTTTRRGNQ